MLKLPEEAWDNARKTVDAVNYRTESSEYTPVLERAVLVRAVSSYHPFNRRVRAMSAREQRGTRRSSLCRRMCLVEKMKKVR